MDRVDADIAAFDDDHPTLLGGVRLEAIGRRGSPSAGNAA